MIHCSSTALQEMLSKKESEIGQLKGTILRRQQKSQARSEQTRKELTDAWLRKRMGLEDMCLELQIHFCVKVKISSEVLFCSPPKLAKLNKLYLHCQVNVAATQRIMNCSMIRIKNITLIKKKKKKK
eukprot:295020_1